MPPRAENQVGSGPPFLVLLEVHLSKLSAMDVLEQPAPMGRDAKAMSTTIAKSATIAKVMCKHERRAKARLVSRNLLPHLLQIILSLSEGPVLLMAASVHQENFKLCDDASQDQGHRNPRDGAMEGTLPPYGI
ncbi:unnamed protein product [Calypogeia fissa]